MARKKRLWTRAIEEAGVTVRIYERSAGGVLQREVWTDGRRDRASLGHTDRQLAEQQARTLAQRIAELRFAGQGARVTLGQLTSLHELHRVPLLSAERQRTVRGQVALLVAHFGRAFVVEELSQHDVDRYVQARQTGRVKSPRHRGPGEGVRAGTIRNELHLLGAMLKWGRGHRVHRRRLLTLDPLEGLRLPAEKNMRRPIATEDRFRLTLAKADQVDPMGRFRTLLILARHTGRRISAMCQLRASDVLLSQAAMQRALGAAGMDLAHADQWPHGAIRWPETTDKLGFETVAPISREARAALELYLTEHPRVGDAPLFPATGDDAAAVHKVLAGYWLKRAEVLAGLPKMERGAWHAFRRLWASERRHLPAQDTAAAGGWRSLAVMRTAYQHADAAGVLAVVENAPSARSAPETKARRHSAVTRRRKG